MEPKVRAASSLGCLGLWVLEAVGKRGKERI